LGYFWAEDEAVEVPEGGGEALVVWEAGVPVVAVVGLGSGSGAVLRLGAAACCAFFARKTLLRALVRSCFRLAFCSGVRWGVGVGVVKWEGEVGVPVVAVLGLGLGLGLLIAAGSFLAVACFSREALLRAVLSAVARAARSCAVRSRRGGIHMAPGKRGEKVGESRVGKSRGGGVNQKNERAAREEPRQTFHVGLPGRYGKHLAKTVWANLPATSRSERSAGLQ
jgi:hypothetical protein